MIQASFRLTLAADMFRAKVAVGYREGEHEDGDAGGQQSHHVLYPARYSDLGVSATSSN